MLNYEAHRRAALLKAAIFEAAELEPPREDKNPRDDCPGVEGEPRAAKNRAVENEIDKVDGHAEDAPDSQVSRHDKRNEYAAVRSRVGQLMEQPQKHQRRG